MTALIDAELSEPYSVFTYRYFLSAWPHLCFLAFAGARCVGCVVCKLDTHRGVRRGYLAMLVVEIAFRKLSVGTQLVRLALGAMIEEAAEEVRLPTLTLRQHTELSSLRRGCVCLLGCS